jgi:hypothetical protein
MSPTQKIIRVFFIYLLTAAIIIPNLELPATESIDQPRFLPAIPPAIGPWQGKDLDDQKARAFFQVGKDTIFQPLVRTYRNSKKDTEIVLNALEDLKGFQRGIHDPRFCYESRGWTIQRFEDCTLEGKHAGVTLKLLTYTNSANTSKRMEMYGYLAGGEFFTSDIALRFAHFRNRMLKMIGKPRRHLLYLGISTELQKGDETTSFENLKFLMGEILATLTVSKKK